MLNKEQKAALVKEFGGSAKNTGSTAAQIAILTKEIELLTEHFKVNKKDRHSMKGFIAKIEKRKSLSNYLKHENPEEYQKLIAKLGIRK